MIPAPTQIFSGPLSHVGFVVDDIPKAVERWTSAYGAGPFLLLENISFDSIEVPEDESPVTWEHSAAFGRWGEIVVELQQYHDISPTLAEKLRVGSSGFNHISYVVDGPEEVSAGLSEAGMPCFVHATAGGIDFYFHDVPEYGHAIEVHRAGEVSDFFAAVRGLADDWDGSDPLRPAG